MKRFFVVRKQRVYNALRWLVEHHEDYKNVKINHDELATWDSDFQPTALMDSLIQINDTINDDISRTGLATEDLEALDGDLPLTTTAMLDVNNVSEPSVAVTIHQISDLIQEATINVVKGSKIRDPKLDSSYFTSSFPTLFPYGTGKHHLSERERKIPFNTWISLMLRHSSRYVYFLFLKFLDANFHEEFSNRIETLLLYAMILNDEIMHHRKLTT